MKPVSNETLVQQLNWRYATKKFDPRRKISPQDWKSLEDALVLTPSSYGLQLWKFVVVTNPAVRAALRSAAYNQSQITDASHLVVFAARKGFGAADVERHVARVAEVRGLPLTALEGLKNMMLGSANRPPEQVDHWTARQTYIALGNFLSSAAMLGIDACPMEGFEPAQFDQILGLDEKGYTAVVLATAGYRASDDPTAGAPKVRFAPQDIIATVA